MLKIKAITILTITLNPGPEHRMVKMI